MGNETSKFRQDDLDYLADQLCYLTHQDYSTPYSLTINPFISGENIQKQQNELDLQISFISEETEETQPHTSPMENIPPQVNSGLKSQTQQINQQKNQLLHQIMKKVKKITKLNKTKKRIFEVINPQGEFNGNDFGVDDGIRDQNNCKSYHKLVKNYLVQQGLGEFMEKYQSKYHTRYYFIICLLVVLHRLGQQNFSEIYESIVQNELQVQQRKIDRKMNELRCIQDKIQKNESLCLEVDGLKTKEVSLSNQIEHIKVVKFEIENYSVRSCKAFFQGNMEESLRILYLKNDPVMRKKYYFQQALETVKNIQFQVRKICSQC